jgi:UDP:flavonoid glycosyltransferase YjiC (YdhE family)
LARILIGWELGAGRGHSSRLLTLAELLRQRGHEPVFAPQQIGPFAAHGPTWQAPVWPRLLGPLSRRYPRPPATMGDMLAYLGLDDSEAVTAMILAWDRLIADVRPDAVVAEYAPMLQLAVKGRVPCLAWGTGFSLPPDDLPAFPGFTGRPAVVPEEALLAGLNHSLGRAGRGPLAALPEIFAADRSLVSSFRELDPYRQSRRGPVGVPAVDGDLPERLGGVRAIFVYLNTAARRPDALWQGLVQARLPVRIHDPTIGRTDAAMFAKMGIIVEPGPVPFADIVARSRLVVSHGGLGFASSALIAGIPQVVIPFDQEKRLTAEALAELGVCRHLELEGLQAGGLMEALLAAWSDEPLHAHARVVAPDFRARMTITAEEEAAAILEELL